jgi:hypothetical protein
MDRSLALGRVYLASQLLPVLAKWEPHAAKDLIKVFKKAPFQVPNPLANVAETLGEIHTHKSRRALKKLVKSKDRSVSEQESLDKLSSISIPSQGKDPWYKRFTAP